MTEAAPAQIKEADLHQYVMQNGKHKGKRIVNVPVGYLMWMVNDGHSAAAWAEAELKRRGSVLPEIDISGHAIDRASLLCRKIWHLTRGPDEGLHAWLVRMSLEALQRGTRRGEHKILYNGMKFVIKTDHRWPVLLTVMPKKDKPR
jgi:uncharacterized protein (DUF3820 family)